MGILAQLVQCQVGIAQRLRTLGPSMVARGDQVVVYLHRQVGHVAGYRMPVLPRKARQRRHQPFQHLTCTGVHHHDRA